MKIGEDKVRIEKEGVRTEGGDVRIGEEDGVKIEGED